MSFRIRNIHTWMIMQKCKELNIESGFVVPGKEDFLELVKDGKKIIINRAISPYLKHIPGAISEDKITCNYLLQQNGFSVPPFMFCDGIGETELNFLKAHAPVVAKPFDTNKGIEIHMDINSAEALQIAWANIKKVSAKAILQKQAPGKDYRILILDGAIAGMLWNEWPYVIGDGEHTIEELVVQENKKRALTKKDIYGKLTEMLVEIPLESLSRNLQKSGCQKTDILSLNQKIYVGHCGNGWSGSIAHDVTDEVHPTILKKALELADFLDIDVVGLDVRCVDIYLPYADSGFNLIEVNTRPSLVDHEFPLFGTPRNVTEKYLEYLFK